MWRESSGRPHALHTKDPMFKSPVSPGRAASISSEMLERCCSIIDCTELDGPAPMFLLMSMAPPVWVFLRRYAVVPLKKQQMGSVLSCERFFPLVAMFVAMVSLMVVLWSG